MEKSKKEFLENNGFQVGDTKDFLNLTKSEQEEISMNTAEYLTVDNLLKLAAKHNVKLKPGIYRSHDGFICVIGLLGLETGYNWIEFHNGYQLRKAISEKLKINENHIDALEKGFENDNYYSGTKYWLVGHKLRGLHT